MSGKKQRSASFVKMEQRAVQETRVKDLINKYNTKKKSNSPQLRKFGRRRVRKGTSQRRKSALLAVPTNVTEADPAVENSKSKAEQEILLKLEKQQQDFERMLEEQRAEKEALAARLAAAEQNLEQSKTLSAAQEEAARRERERLANALAEQKREHEQSVADHKEVEKDIEASYDTTVKVRRASAALMGKALLGGALAGGVAADAVPEEPDEIVAAMPSPTRSGSTQQPPPMPSRPKPQQPDSDSDSSSTSTSSDSEDDAGGAAAAGGAAGRHLDSDDEGGDHYEENIEEILAKPIEECTPIEKAARRSAVADEDIPMLIDLIPEFEQNAAGLYEFLHSPLPYEQGIVQCEVHRKGKCFYFYLSRSEENDTKFLMFAQDRSGFGAVNLMLSMVANGKRSDPSFLGKVRGNVLNTKYVAFDNGEHPKERAKGVARQEKAFINYTLYSDAPRKMTVVVPKIADDGTVPVFQQSWGKQDLLEAKYLRADNTGVEFSENKQPKWDRKRKCFVLDFKKRATEASVKNFLLVTKEDPEHDSVLFGKCGRDQFNVDVQYPMSFFQAFAICLSAIYSKSAPTFG